MYVWSTTGPLYQVLQSSKNESPEKGPQCVRVIVICDFQSVVLFE